MTRLIDTENVQVTVNSHVVNQRFDATAVETASVTIGDLSIELTAAWDTLLVKASYQGHTIMSLAHDLEMEGASVWVTLFELLQGSAAVLEGEQPFMAAPSWLLSSLPWYQADLEAYRLEMEAAQDAMVWEPFVDLNDQYAELYAEMPYEM